MEPVNGAVIQVPGDDALARAAGIHDQVDGEVFDEEFGVLFQALLVKGVQHGMAGPVRRGAGALHRRFAVVAHVAAEGALVDLAVRCARERYAVVLQFVNRRHRFAAHVFDGILIAEPVRALDRVIHVPAPVVLGHVA